MLPVALAAAIVALVPVPDDHPQVAIRGVGGVTAAEAWAERVGEYGFDRLDDEEAAKAEWAFNAALRLDANHWRYLWGRARAQAMLGRHDAAADDYALMLSTDPTDPDLWQYVAHGWVLRGKLAEAERCFAHALEFCPTEETRCQALVEEAMLWMGAMPRRQLPKTLKGTRYSAVTTESQARGHSAERLVRAEIALTCSLLVDCERKPDFLADSLMSRGAIRYLLGRLGEAVRDVDDALAANPASANAHQLRARLAVEQRDADLALTHIDLAARCGSDPLIIARERCNLFVQFGDYAKAEEAARERCRLDPRWADAFRQHAELLRLLGEDEEADRATERAAELSGEVVPLEFMSQAKTLYDQYRKPALTDRVFTRLLERPGLTRETCAVVVANRAAFLSQIGRVEEGFHESNIAAGLTFTSPNILKARVEIALQAKKDAMAMEAARAFLRHWPNDPEAGELWRKCRESEELRAGIANRPPDFRRPGPFEPVPISVTSAPQLMECVGHLKEYYR